MPSTPWKLKLKAFLHDPPHKVTVSFLQKRDHEAVAEQIVTKFLGISALPTDEERARIQWADWLSAAMTRLLTEDIRPTEEEALQDIERTGHLTVRDPWRGDQRIGLYARLRLAEAFKIVRRNLDPIHEDVDFLRFLLVYRVWPEEFTTPEVDGRRHHVMLEFPADTRAPNHSLFDHLTQVSALVACWPRPALILVSIRPVQKFIQTARKTQDLLAGSYLLSWLAWNGARAIIERWGPDHLVFPSMFHQGLFDWWLLHRVRTQNPPLNRTLRKKPYPWYKLLRTASLPNRLLAIVPWDEHDTPLQVVRAAMQDAWEQCVRQALMLAVYAIEHRNTVGLRQAVQRILAHDEIPQDAVSPTWQTWIARAWETARGYFRWTGVMVPFDLNVSDGGDALWQPETVDRWVTALQQWLDLPKNLREVLHALRQHPRYGTARLPITLGYAGLYRLIERLHAAVKAQSMPELPAASPTGRLCSLCGERVEIGTLWAREQTEQPELRFQELNRVADSRFWWPMRIPATGWPVLVREGERLCAVCWTKRVFLHLLEEHLTRDVQPDEPLELPRFPSTHEMGAVVFKDTVVEYWEHVNDVVRGKVRIFLDTLWGEEAPSEVREHFRTRTVPKLQRAARNRKVLEAFVQTDGFWLAPDRIDVHDLQREYGIPEVRKPTCEKWLQRVKTAWQAFRQAWADWQKQNARERQRLPSVESYYAIVMLDGDHMGKWLSSQKNPSIRKVLNEVIMQHLRDVPFLDRPHPMSPAWHSMLSRYLTEYASHHVLEVCTERFPVQLVYAGGDDVLLLAPIRYALQVADILQQKFREHVLDGGSMSAGIVIAHVKYPLGLALQEARAAERSAKERRQRNAFELRVLKRSGERLTTGMRWELQDDTGVVHPSKVFYRLLDALTDPTFGLAARFPYRFAAAVAEILPPPGADRSESGADGAIREVAAALLQLHFDRSCHPAMRAQRQADWTELQQQLLHLLQRAPSVRDFTHLLLAAAFIAQPEE